MRALKIATIAMGVLLVAGTASLAVLIAQRLTGAGRAAPFAATLDEPAGTRIAGIATLRDRLAIQLQGGGPDRILLLDPRTGGTTGSIMLRPATRER